MSQPAVWWRLGADAALAAHALWVLTYAFGPLAGLRFRKWKFFQLGMMAFTLVLWPLWGGCPLTTLENALRRRAGGAVYPGGFIAHYLEKIVYWDLPKGTLAWAAALWFLLWAGIYAALWMRGRKTKS